jgi:hypothetical protein
VTRRICDRRLLEHLVRPRALSARSPWFELLRVSGHSPVSAFGFYRIPNAAHLARGRGAVDLALPSVGDTVEYISTIGGN